MLATDAPVEGRHLTTHIDSERGIAWATMHGQPRPCCNPGQLDEVLDWSRGLERLLDSPGAPDIRYMVLASSVPGTFSVGGDLDLFVRLIEARDRAGLERYAYTCCELIDTFATHLERPEITSVALVQDTALGGGFEAALAANVLIAERGTLMGFPEILFDLFPGMGALTFLARRVGHAKAQQMILSGQRFTAEELHELGVVDLLADPGAGVEALHDFVRRDQRRANGTRALRQAVDLSLPSTRAEVFGITDIWVDAAMRLEGRALATMKRLVASQNDKYQEVDATATEEYRIAA